MALLNTRDWIAAEALAGIGYANPFLPERIELEQKALGSKSIGRRSFVHYRPDWSLEEMFPNFRALRQRCEHLAELTRRRLLAGEEASERELLVYEDLVYFLLYSRYMASFAELPVIQLRHRNEADIRNSYEEYAKDYAYFLRLPGARLPSALDAETIFAGLFQIERAFFHVFNYIVGGSVAAARLRAAVWQSIFTHDMRRYSRSLYRVMGNLTTLVTGPSGTGKELVARAIAYSRFVEFDPKARAFVADFTKSFIGLNLSAVAPTLIESELFGHSQGAFTGAHKPRAGYLDETVCRSCDTVFLDEVGELDGPMQVKLLRVLQSREFQRVGEAKTRRFVGKIVAATNRDLDQEIAAGRFREDFYYRLCSDRIHTPSLREQLQDAPDDLSNFVRFIATHLLPGLEEEADKLTDEAVSWIHGRLPPDYPWAGNFRELEQCVRSIMIRGDYTPRVRPSADELSPDDEFLHKVAGGRLTREELLQGYFSLVYSKTGSYRGAARQLGVDWRTVQHTVRNPR
jgi:hypothetical protein